MPFDFICNSFYLILLFSPVTPHEDGAMQCRVPGFLISPCLSSGACLYPTLAEESKQYGRFAFYGICMTRFDTFPP